MLADISILPFRPRRLSFGSLLFLLNSWRWHVRSIDGVEGATRIGRLRMRESRNGGDRKRFTRRAVLQTAGSAALALGSSAGMGGLGSVPAAAQHSSRPAALTTPSSFSRIKSAISGQESCPTDIPCPDASAWRAKA